MIEISWQKADVGADAVFVDTTLLVVLHLLLMLVVMVVKVFGVCVPN